MDAERRQRRLERIRAQGGDRLGRIVGMVSGTSGSGTESGSGAPTGQTTTVHGTPMAATTAQPFTPTTIVPGVGPVAQSPSVPRTPIVGRTSLVDGGKPVATSAANAPATMDASGVFKVPAVPASRVAAPAAAVEDLPAFVDPLEASSTASAPQPQPPTDPVQRAHTIAMLLCGIVAALWIIVQTALLARGSATTAHHGVLSWEAYADTARELLIDGAELRGKAAAAIQRIMFPVDDVVHREMDADEEGNAFDDWAVTRGDAARVGDELTVIAHRVCVSLLTFAFIQSQAPLLWAFLLGQFLLRTTLPLLGNRASSMPSQRGVISAWTFARTIIDDFCLYLFVAIVALVSWSYSAAEMLA